MTGFKAIRPIWIEERRKRSGQWLGYSLRIYRIIAAAEKAGIVAPMGMVERWKLAAWWFHSWVWGYCELPWDSEKKS